MKDITKKEIIETEDYTEVDETVEDEVNDYEPETEAENETEDELTLGDKLFTAGALLVTGIAGAFVYDKVVKPVGKAVAKKTKSGLAKLTTKLMEKTKKPAEIEAPKEEPKVEEPETETSTEETED